VPHNRAWIVGVRQYLARSLVAALVAWTISGAALADAGERKTLLVGSESDYPPYAITTEDGEADGFSVDLIKAVAEQEGLDLKFHIGPWNEVKAMLEQGKIDLLPHVYYSHERDKAFDFSVTHTSADAAWFVRTGEDANRAVKDFHGKSVIAMRSDWTHEYLLANDLTDDIVLVDTVPEALQALSAGQHDAAFLPLLVGRLLVRDLEHSNIQVAGDPVKVGKGFAFAVREGDTTLVQRLNDGLALVQASGRYDEIFEKWFGVVPPRGASESVLGRYAMWVVIGIAVIATLVIVWIVLLRRTVARQTAELTHAYDNLEARVRERTDELHRSERALAEAQRIAKIGNWRLDARSGDLYWSDEIYRIFGRTPGEFAPSDERFFETIHPDDVTAVRESVAQTLSHGTPHSIDHRIVLPDGSVRWVHEEGVRTLDENGVARTMSGTVQDITQRKLLEERLQESEERLRAIIYNAPYTISLKDRDGRFILTNRAFENWYGRSPGELIGEKVSIVIQEGLVEAHEAQDAEVLRTAKTIQREHEVPLADGRMHTILVTKFPVHGTDGEAVGVGTINVDITDLKAAETLVSRFGRMVEGSLNEIYVFDSETLRFMQVNYGARSNLGYSIEELAQLTPVDIKPELTPPEFDALILPLRTGEQETLVFETVHQRKDSSTYDVEVHLQLMHDETPPVFVAIIQDVTEQKLARRAVEERKVAEASNLAKSQFLANMSHEIRTPMNGVVGMAEILSRMDLQPEQSRMVRTIRDSSESLLRIIDDILDISKIEAGKLRLENAPMGLQNLFEGVVQTLRPFANEQNVRILFDLRSFPPFIEGDAVRLRQILMNLMNNAIKFSRPRDGEEKERGQVELRVERGGSGSVVISVIDNGIGMSDEVIAKLFRPFSQAEESTTRVYGGTGLGLTITKTLVGMMGGDIGVESEPGVGSTFKVTLPVVETEGTSDDPDLSGVKILALIDVDIDIKRGYEVLRRYLEPAGASIEFFANEADLKAAQDKAEDGTIVLLSLPSAAENDRVRQALSDGSGRIRYLRLVKELGDSSPCRLPDCFTVYQFPLLPSDLLHGLAVLAERASPAIDLDENLTTNAPALEEDEENLTILLVEDNEINQDVIATQLKMLGYGVDVAENGAVGLEKWKSGKHDLVLADCHMPVMDGFEMTGEIREHEIGHGMARTPIVAITANALKGEAEKCLAAGMDDFLSKPVVLVDLKKTLSGWISRGA
jgi:PAS domain S-box-containing protein